MKILFLTVFFHIILIINGQCGIRWRGRCGRTVSKRDSPGLHYLDSEDQNKTMGSLFSKTTALDFKRIKTIQNKLNYLRKLCKTILKNSQENEGIAIVKACKKFTFINLFKFSKKIIRTST